MLVETPIPGVVWLRFETRKEMGLSLYRIQEFYESKYPKIRGKEFDTHDFLEQYMDDDGNIDYFSYFDGYNFPVSVYWEFFVKCSTETDQEFQVFQVLHTGKYQYLIATLIDDVYDAYTHELAHALYYTNHSYKQGCDKIVNSIPEPILHNLCVGLTAVGYDSSVFLDEIQAYLATGLDSELSEVFPLVTIESIESFRKQLWVLFLKYR